MSLPVNAPLISSMTTKEYAVSRGKSKVQDCIMLYSVSQTNMENKEMQDDLGFSLFSCGDVVCCTYNTIADLFLIILHHYTTPFKCNGWFGKT